MCVVSSKHIKMQGGPFKVMVRLTALPWFRASGWCSFALQYKEHSHLKWHTFAIIICMLSCSFVRCHSCCRYVLFLCLVIYQDLFNVQVCCSHCGVLFCHCCILMPLSISCILLSLPTPWVLSPTIFNQNLIQKHQAPQWQQQWQRHWQLQHQQLIVKQASKQASNKTEWNASIETTSGWGWSPPGCDLDLVALRSLS